MVTTAGRWCGGDWSVCTDGMAAEVSGRDRDLEYRDAISRAVARSAAELVTADTMEDAIPRILKTIGETITVDRVFVLETPLAGAPLKLRDIWHGPSVPAEPGQERSPGLRADKFRAGSNLQAPIMVDGNQWGVLALDDCLAERAWSAAESGAVHVVADLIGAAINRERHIKNLSNADQVVRSSPAIVYRMAVDGERPRLTYVSENVSLLGISARELMADPALSIAIIHPDDRAAVEASLAATMASAPAEFAGSCRCPPGRIAAVPGRRRSGAYRWVENRYKLTRDNSGRLVEMAGVLIDVTERTVADKELRFVNALLTTLKNSSPDGILMVDDDLQTLSVNRRFLEMSAEWRLPTDLAVAEHGKGALVAAMSAVEDPAAFMSLIRHLAEHPEETAQDELAMKNGRLIDRQTAPLRSASGKRLGRAWYFRDVTEQRRAVETLAASETRFKAILEAAGDGIAVIDGETLRFTLVNQALCDMLGYSHDELMSIGVGSIYRGVEASEVSWRIRRIADGISRKVPALRITRKDGSEFLADIAAAPMTLKGRNYAVASFRDVTDRKQAEASLQRERDFSSAIIDDLPGLFFVLNSRGRIVRSNAGMSPATGKSTAELQGASPLACVAEPDRAFAVSKFNEALARGHAQGEIGVSDSAGTSHPYFLTAAKIELEDGPGFLGIGVDVSEARRGEKLLREGEQRFRAIFKSVSDGIFVYENRHHLRIEANQTACDMFGYSREESSMRLRQPVLGRRALYAGGGPQAV